MTREQIWELAKIEAQYLIAQGRATATLSQVANQLYYREIHLYRCLEILQEDQGER